ncbi:MAG: response regulator [Chloroflexota bacterium]
MNSQESFPKVLAGRLILLIDDVHDNVEIMQEALEWSGAEVIIAYDGLEGLEKAALHPDVIVSDLAMPVMTGYELLQALKDNRATAQIPVIVLTAHATDSYRIAAFEAGSHNFLVKPVSITTLVNEILSVLQDTEYALKLPPV